MDPPLVAPEEPALPVDPEPLAELPSLLIMPSIWHIRLGPDVPAEVEPSAGH